MSSDLVDARDLAKAAGALEPRAFARTAGDAIAPALQTAGQAVQRHVKAEAKPHRRTGALERGIVTKVSGRGLGTVVRVHAGGPEAHLLAGGTKPHTITPVRGRALAMTAPARAGGPLGFAGVVHHPGTRPDPFVERGVIAAGADVHRITDQAGATTARELAHDMEG